jgi:hypothetical protein
VRLVALLIALPAVACTDPVLEMQLVMPKTTDMTASCITAVEVHANGATYPAVKTDQIRSCIEITAGSSYATVRDAIKGKFSLGMPSSGLSSIEIFGWAGPAACMDDGNPYASPDLLFSGNADYIGQANVEIPVTPNVDCALAPVNVRMYDMFALVGGASCTAAIAPGAMNGAGTGTLVPRAHGKGSEFFGNMEGANMVNNLASFQGHTHVGPKTCLAVDGGGSMGGSTGCVIGGPNVCAGNGEIEHVFLPNTILSATSNFDPTITAKFPGVIIGSVWTGGATKVPIANATVQVDSAHGKVVYIDPPAAGQSALHVRSETSTGPSGLFMVYTDTLINAKVTANGATRTVTLGAADSTVAGAMIVMP